MSPWGTDNSEAIPMCLKCPLIGKFDFQLT